MAAVSRIDLRIRTAAGDASATNGRVYLGLGGREFRIPGPFRSGEDRTYTFGESANVAEVEWNDPRRHLPLDHLDMGRHPTYLRLEMTDSSANWHIGLVELVVHAVGTSITKAKLEGNDSLWLGDPYGKILYL